MTVVQVDLSIFQVYSIDCRSWHKNASWTRFGCNIVAHLYHLYYFETAQVSGVASLVSATR